MEDPINSIPVKIYAMKGATLPRQATPGSAALDVCACLELDTEIRIPPGERMAIPTGLFMEIPHGYFVSMRPRSGLALKHGVSLPNSPATIDSDYRGELKVIMINLGKQDFVIRHGDRIAQMILERVVPFHFEKVDHPGELSDTDRGAGGFGSTGTGLV